MITPELNPDSVYLKVSRSLISHTQWGSINQFEKEKIYWMPLKRVGLAGPISIYLSLNTPIQSVGRVAFGEILWSNMGKGRFKDRESKGIFDR